jgi:hypothetical protein
VAEPAGVTSRFLIAGEVQVASPNSTAPLDFDVTTIVQNWASGSWRNYGLSIMTEPYADPGYDSWGSTGF